MAPLVLSLNMNRWISAWALTSRSDCRPIASVVVCTSERRDPRPRLSALSESNNSDNSASVIDSSVIQTALYGLSVVHWHLGNLCGCVLLLLATRSSRPLAWRVRFRPVYTSAESVWYYFAECLLWEGLVRSWRGSCESMRVPCEFMEGSYSFIIGSFELMIGFVSSW